MVLQSKILGGDFANIASLDGDNDYIGLANSTDINLGNHAQRTISLWFRADDLNITTRKQVLYEEGGSIRGLNIYLEKGKLYVGGWNTLESAWAGTYLATEQISSPQWHHVALVLDGSTTVQPNSLTAYLDGQEFGSGDGSQLWAHSGAIALGNVLGGTKFHSGSSSDLTHGLEGNIDRVQIYNRALNNTEINSLYTAITPPATLSSVEEGLIAHLEFNETSGTLAADSSPFGEDNPGNLLNGASFATGVVSFDGNDDYISIDNSSDINLGIHARRTISLWFKADDINVINRKQVLYEEGGGTRGLNIYLDAGALYVGGWNTHESSWSGTYLLTNTITANSWHHVALVLDGEATVQPNSLTAYLDGQEFGSGDGSQLWSHGDAIGLGAINGATRFHDGATTRSNAFGGSLDELQIYNRALDSLEVENLFTSFASPIV